MKKDSTISEKRNWLPRRFSLRMLLILTTACATVLWYVVDPYLTHRRRVSTVDRYFQMRGTLISKRELLLDDAWGRWYWEKVVQVIGEESLPDLMPTEIEAVDLSVSNSQLTSIAKLKSFCDVNLDNTNADDKVIGEFCNSLRLRKISLNNTDITDESLDDLAKNVNFFLAEIDAYRTSLTEAKVEDFRKQFPRVALNWSPRLSERDAKAIRALANTRSFEITFGSPSLKIEPLKKLEEIDISPLFMMESPIELEIFGGFRMAKWAQKYLNEHKKEDGFNCIGSLPIHPSKWESLDWLTEMSNLRELTVTATEYEGQLPQSSDKLEKLFIVSTRLSEEDFLELPVTESLKSLILEADYLTDCAAVHIMDFKNLEFIRLLDSQISTFGLFELAKLKHLEELELQSNNLKDGSPLWKMKKLKVLDLSETQVDDSIFEDIKHLDLRFLGLSKTNVSTEAFYRFLDEHPEFTRYRFQGQYFGEVAK